MSEARMDVILLNQPQAGIDRQTLVHNLATAFKKEPSVIDGMLSQPRTLLKKSVEESVARKYQAVIENAGGMCELVSLVEQPLELEAMEAEQTPVTHSVASSEAQHYCYKCGTLLQKHMQVCPKCFTPPVHLTARNKTLAGFLALFLGGLGVHRFYLGQWWGIFYIAFWFTFIPSLVSIVEALVFWFTSDERWNKKYGQVPKSGGTMVAIFAVSFFLFVMLVGMLAAIALPAYQEYTTRAKIASAMLLVNDTREKVTAFINNTGFLPNQNLDASLPEVIGNDIVALEVIEGGKIKVTYDIRDLNHYGNTIIWTPTVDGDQVIWSCREGTVPDRYRNQECRGGTGANKNPKTNAAAKEMPALSNRLFSDDNRFSIDVPKNWKDAPDLNEDASIGAQNLFEAGFALVIAEPKEDFEEGFVLADYTQLIVSLMQQNIPDAKTPGKLRQLDVDGLPAEQLILTGTVDNIKIGYVITTIESDEGFYQVITWTLLSRLKEKHPLLRSIGRSFSLHE